jgi:surface protein
MFKKAFSFNKNIDRWNVLNVTDMSFMFNGAISFNQNISNWNVSNYTHIDNMFCFNTPIQFYKLNTTSFFDEPFIYMEPLKRTQEFNVLFHWDRRKHFLKFLTDNNYITHRTQTQTPINK